MVQGRFTLCESLKCTKNPNCVQPNSEAITISVCVAFTAKKKRKKKWDSTK